MTRRVVRYSLAIVLACAALFAAPAAHALDTGDIVVASLKGEVQVTMKGAPRTVRAGTVLELPATVRTGRDGAIDLRQGATSVSVGPDTLLEFPALEKAGGPIDRIVQPRGNAFYSIGKREGRKLRVETPYLVGVVKGTQFNVAARDDATTISLFEGLLEIRAADDSSVVDIKAGEIASRGRGDKSISVLKMDSGKAPPPRAPSGARGDGNGAPTPGSASPRGIPASSDAGNALVSDDTTRPTGVTLVNSPSTIVDTVSDTNLRGGAAVETGGAPNVGASAAVDVGGGTATVDAGASVGLPATAAAIELSVGAGAGAVDVGTGATVTAGPATVDTSINAGVDLGGGAASVGVDASTSVNVGNAAAVDVGAAAAVDLGNGAAASVDVNAGVNAGPLTTDVGAGAAVDLGGSQGAASVDVGATAAVDVAGAAAVDLNAGAAVDVGATTSVAADVGASVAGVDAGVSTGVDVGAGTVDLGVNVAGTDLNVGVDLGLDNNDDQGQDTGSKPPATPGNVVNDVVDTVDGVLNGLLRKPGKK